MYSIQKIVTNSITLTRRTEVWSTT